MVMMELTGEQIEKEKAWKGLYYAGAASALLAALVFRRFLAAEMEISNGFGIFRMPQSPLVTASDWFIYLAEAPLAGLILLNAVDLINYLLVGLIFLALYGALRRRARSAMVAATAFAFVGIAVFWASNQAFNMLALSQKYGQAVTIGERERYLAAGEALLVQMDAGGGYYSSLLLVLLAGLTISIVMWHSVVFNKATAVVGILANGLALTFFIIQPLAPAWIWLPHALSAPFRLIWYILIAIQLIRLGRNL